MSEIELSARMYDLLARVEARGAAPVTDAEEAVDRAIDCVIDNVRVNSLDGMGGWESADEVFEAYDIDVAALSPTEQVVAAATLDRWLDEYARTPLTALVQTPSELMRRQTQDAA